jgi:hypothetical protein
MDYPDHGCMGKQDKKSKRNAKYSKLYYRQLLSSITRCLLYLSKTNKDGWVEYLKHITLNFYAYHETDGLDMIPGLEALESDHQPAVLFGGVFTSFQFKLKKSRPTAFASFILSINMAKMGLPRPTEEMVSKKTWETANFLCSEPRPLPEEEEIWIRNQKGKPSILKITKKLIQDQIIRTTRECFRKKDYTFQHHYEPFCPSTNANYVWGRSNGGAVMTVEDIIDGLGLKVNENLIEIREVNVRASALLIEKACYHDKDEDLLDLAMMNDEVDIKGYTYDDSNLCRNWEELMEKLELDALYEMPLVTPVGLSEALKVRVISKGPPKLYTYLKPFQKFMHSTLRKMKVFRLIGEPVTEAIINDVFPASTVKPETIFLNGDYKASTDNLRGWASETSANALCDILDENKTDTSKTINREMLLRSLTGHKYRFEDGSIKDQLDGQLMGSISSFPFLCIINAALCRFALECVEGKRISLNEAPLLVNGDDCTMSATRDDTAIGWFEDLNLRYIWSKFTNFAGLTSSQGKTLFSQPSKPIVVINSMTFDFGDERRWIRRKFVPLGIMLNKPRSGLTGDTKTRSYGTLGALHRELHDMCPEELWDVVSSEFIKRVKPILDRCPNIPWYTPEYLGGPGLLPPRGEDGEIRVKSYDLKLFTWMIMNLGKGDLQPMKARTLHEWKFHDQVLKVLKQHNIKETIYPLARVDGIEMDYDMDSEGSLLYKKLVVESLFKTDIRDLHQPIKDEKLQDRYDVRAERNNMKFHKTLASLMKNKTHIITRTWSEIETQKVFTYYPIIGTYQFHYDRAWELFQEDGKGWLLAH